MNRRSLALRNGDGLLGCAFNHDIVDVALLDNQRKPPHPIMYGGKPSTDAVGQQPEQRELHDEPNDLRLLVSVEMGRANGAKHGPTANILPEV